MSRKHKKNETKTYNFIKKHFTARLRNKLIFKYVKWVFKFRYDQSEWQCAE